VEVQAKAQVAQPARRLSAVSLRGGRSPFQSDAHKALATRAKATNDPFSLPLVNKRAQDRRRRDLVTAFIAGLGGPSAASELALIHVRRAVELTVAAEQTRAAMLTGAAVDLDQLVKLEGEARRAMRTLGIKLGPKPHVPLRDRIAEAAE
jgi:hypothetical protein